MAAVMALAAESQALGEAKPGREITDMAGRAVLLPLEIKNIGTLGSVGVLNALVEAMGEGSKIMNRLPHSFASSGRWGLQREFAPRSEFGPLFEGASRELLIENVIMAKPDVVLAMAKELCDHMDRIGVPCVYLEWKDLGDIKDAMELMGQVLGRPDRAKRYLEWFDQKIALAEELTKGLPEKRKPKVLYGDPLRLSQPHQIAEWWIAKAGGRSVTSQSMVKGSLKYNIEDLLLWDPEVMILLSHSDVSEIKKNENLKNVNAVKNDKFYFIPTVAHTWGNRTVEQPLTVLWAIHQFHPNLLSRERLAQEIKDFYSTFFLYELSEERINAIIGGPDFD
ncbi:MAG: ABC transporter substrate-binding protein [Deltaproteobacteria bacterium]|nr:ABC transporter substrate-binding protein [Deltaproteobacteria bacterium]